MPNPSSKILYNKPLLSNSFSTSSTVAAVLFFLLSPINFATVIVPVPTPKKKKNGLVKRGISNETPNLKDKQHKIIIVHHNICILDRLKCLYFIPPL